MSQAEDDRIPDDASNDFGKSMRAVMEQRRARERGVFGCCLDEDWRAPVADIAMLPLDEMSDEFKNEFRVTRLLVLLLRERRRARFGEIARGHHHGSQERDRAHSYSDLNQIAENLRLAESALGIMAGDEAARNQLELRGQPLGMRGAKSSTWPADSQAAPGDIRVLRGSRAVGNGAF